jgi:hypothetical protein
MAIFEGETERKRAGSPVRTNRSRAAVCRVCPGGEVTGLAPGTAGNGSLSRTDLWLTSRKGIHEPVIAALAFFAAFSKDVPESILESRVRQWAEGGATVRTNRWVSKPVS